MNYKSILFFALLIPCFLSAQTDSLKGDERLGVFVREVTIRVAPEDVMKWEEAMHKIADAAVKAKPVGLDWLLYRSQPNEYWMILFGEKIEEVPGEKAIHKAFMGTAGEPEYKEALGLFAQTDFEIVRDIVCQHDLLWSTVERMSTSTHPKARVVDYWVKPGAEATFDKLLQKKAKYLLAINYPYPVESFRPRIGAPRVFQVVTFPDNWRDFYGNNDLETWAEKMGKRAELDEIDKQISGTILKSSYHDLDHSRELSSP